jgi:hypothetical protein
MTAKKKSSLYGKPWIAWLDEKLASQLVARSQ